ncbi:MAG: hypothetical protein QW385_07525 [Thermoproteota archaeon]
MPSPVRVAEPMVNMKARTPMTGEPKTYRRIILFSFSKPLER